MSEETTLVISLTCSENTTVVNLDIADISPKIEFATSEEVEEFLVSLESVLTTSEETIPSTPETAPAISFATSKETTPVKAVITPEIALTNDDAAIEVILIEDSDSETESRSVPSPKPKGKRKRVTVKIKEELMNKREKRED